MGASSTAADETAQAAQAAQALFDLQEQAEDERAVLALLREEVAEAVSQLAPRQTELLREANQQLVLSMLRARTDAETAEQALEEMAQMVGLDALTGLPNRSVLLDRLAQAIAGARRRGVRLALLFLDFNNFKEINDSFGHGVGDNVLKLAARRLTASVRAADTVSRHGGDEFLILLTEVKEPGDALLFGRKLLARLAAPSQVGAHRFRLTASIGISLYPDDGEDVDTLIERADAAMYRAKRGGLRCCLYGGEPLR